MGHRITDTDGTDGCVVGIGGNAVPLLIRPGVPPPERRTPDNLTVACSAVRHHGAPTFGPSTHQPMALRTEHTVDNASAAVQPR